MGSTPWKFSFSKKRRKNEANRLSKSSKCNWRFLSPKSAKKRLRNLTSDARRVSKDLKRLNKKVQVSLNSELSGQMEQITNKISSQFREDLNNIFEKAELKTKGNGKLLKAMWQQDVDEKKGFWKDQSRNGRHSKYILCISKNRNIEFLHTAVWHKLAFNSTVSCKCPVSNILIKSWFVYWVTASFKVDQDYKISKIIFLPYLS